MLRKIFLFIFFLTSFFANNTFAVMNDYFIYPPFIGGDNPVNILLVFDKSGSMSEPGYGGTFLGTEEGYFRPDKIYSMTTISGTDVWVEDPGPAEKDCPWINNSKKFTGACINYRKMKRVDLLRWALTGGRPLECSGDNSSSCDPNMQCPNFGFTDHCVIQSYNSTNVKVPMSRINEGVLQQFENSVKKPRFGLILYGGSSVYGNKVYIGDYYNEGNADQNRVYTNVKRLINFVAPTGGTPTKYAMEEAYDLFDQQNNYTNTTGFNLYDGSTSSLQFRDPMYFCDHNKQNCNLIACAKNYVVLASDGEWNHGGDPISVSYHMHKDLLRTFTSPSGIPFNIRVEKVYSLAIFVEGDGARALKNIAMYGAFDLNSGLTWPSGTAGLPANSLTTDIPAANPPTRPDWDIKPSGAPDGVPDTFYSSQSGAAIRNAFYSIFTDILGQSSSGASVSTTSSDVAVAGTGNLLAQPLFYPEFSSGGVTAKWIGKLNLLWYYLGSKYKNIRDNNLGNQYLDVWGGASNAVHDWIISSEPDCSNIGKYVIKGYKSAADGNKTTEMANYGSLVENIPEIAELGEKLSTSAGGRTIYGVDNTNNMISFTSANAASFDFGTNEIPACLPAPATQSLVTYIRGENDYTCRSRRYSPTIPIWKLGDIVYSSPALLTDEKNDKTYVFVGANDGMLHVFRIGHLKKLTESRRAAELCDNNSTCTGSLVNIGQEIWSFIPKNAMPYLRYYANLDYDHIYTVDGKPYIVEFYDNPDLQEKVVKRYLIGSMRFGGGSAGTFANGFIRPPTDTCLDYNATSCVGRSSYFAIDITDPENPIFRWEFTHKDLGLTYPGPGVIKYKTAANFTNNSYKDAWVVFATGPFNYEGLPNSAKKLKIFTFPLDTLDHAPAEPLVTVKEPTTSLPEAFAGTLYTDHHRIEFLDTSGATPVRTTKKVLAFGYTQRNGSNWNGGIIWGDVNATNNPAAWTFTPYNNFGGAVAPVTTKVQFSSCFDWPSIYFATGRWLHKANVDAAATRDVLYSAPIDKGFLPITNNLDMTTGCSSAPQCSNFITAGNRTAGWRIRLEPAAHSTKVWTCAGSYTHYDKERCLADPTTSSYDTVNFATTKVTSDLCGFGGVSRVWGLNCATGCSIFKGCVDGTITKLKPNIPKRSGILIHTSSGVVVDRSHSPNPYTSDVDAGIGSGNERATGWVPGMASTSEGEGEQLKYQTFFER